jgi:hypothetical protein
MWHPLNQPLTCFLSLPLPLPPLLFWLNAQVFAKFDTSLEPLEPLSAELNVKALPVFRFYKASSNGRQGAPPV